MEIQIIKTRRKTVSLEVKRDGSVIVRAPLRMPQREIQEFIDSHRSWIEHKCRLMEKRRTQSVSTGAPPVDEISGRNGKKFGRSLQTECIIIVRRWMYRWAGSP